MKRFGIIFISLLAFNSISGQEQTFQKTKPRTSPTQTADKKFSQPVSVKYLVPESLKGAELKKLVIDYNDVVYTLTSKGLYYVSEGKLVKDIRYTPLADLTPVDITIQEGSGHLYYLYADHFLTNGYAGVPYGNFPAGKFDKIAVTADGSVLLAGDEKVAVYQLGNLKEINWNGKAIISVHSWEGLFYIRTAEGVYKLKGDEWVLLHEGKGLKAITFRKNEIVLGTSGGYYGISLLNGKSTFPLQTAVPVQDIDCLISVNGKIWAGTPQGGFEQQSPGNFRYYASKRWLNDDRVTGIASDSKGNIYLLTPSGLNQVHFLQQTLAEKTAYFQDNIRQRHIRYGFIANLILQKQGDLASGQLKDTDNDGLWSAFYLGSQVFRYAVTKEPEAKRYAWEAFEAFERIISINPLKGFPARTFERTGYKYSDPQNWHDSQEKGWEWKGTTSSDEFVAYIWVAAIMNEMAAQTPSEKQRVAAFIDKILTHIIDNNYYLVDADGKPTLWGRWNPEYINSFPETVGDRRLGSSTIIAGLELGYALTGKQKYKSEAFRLINDHGYLKNITLPYTNIKATPGTIHQGIDLGDGGWNHSDDEMAFLTYWVLYRYAFNQDQKDKYKVSIRDHWQIEKPERNAVWNLITLGTIGTFDKASTIWQLREFPMDLIRWDVKNSHRKDIVLLPPNFRNQTTEKLLPPGEMPMHRHNANAFDLDDGEGGKTELAGDEYLLPYWMARYLKVIQ
ncbi:MAG: hypothetical protein ABI687_04730 [Flavitalea sp.]